MLWADEQRVLDDLSTILRAKRQRRPGGEKAIEELVCKLLSEERPVCSPPVPGGAISTRHDRNQTRL
jgi:hypothetical protein